MEQGNGTECAWGRGNGILERSKGDTFQVEGAVGPKEGMGLECLGNRKSAGVAGVN